MSTPEENKLLEDIRDNPSEGNTYIRHFSHVYRNADFTNNPRAKFAASQLKIGSKDTGRMEEKEYRALLEEMQNLANIHGNEWLEDVYAPRRTNEDIRHITYIRDLYTQRPTTPSAHWVKGHVLGLYHIDAEGLLYGKRLPIQIIQRMHITRLDLSHLKILIEQEKLKYVKNLHINQLISSDHVELLKKYTVHHLWQLFLHVDPEKAEILSTAEIPHMENFIVQTTSKDRPNVIALLAQNPHLSLESMQSLVHDNVLLTFKRREEPSDPAPPAEKDRTPPQSWLQRMFAWMKKRK